MGLGTRLNYDIQAEHVWFICDHLTEKNNNYYCNAQDVL